MQKIAKKIVVLAKKGCFRPKIALTSENNSYGRKFSYGLNFGYSNISGFLKLFLTVTVFRSHTIVEVVEGAMVLVLVMAVEGAMVIVPVIARCASLGS